MLKLFSLYLNMLFIIHLGKDFVIEALQFHLVKFLQLFTILQTIQSIPRHCLNSVEVYDIINTKRRQIEGVLMV